ncbi:MAG: RNA methyltransferase [Bacillota bacterium]
MDRISSPQNPRAKYLRHLHRRSFREREGRFLVEGVRFVQEALRAGWPLDAVVYTERLLEDPRGAALLQEARARGIPLWETAPAVFAGVATTATPQGVLAVAAVRAFTLAEILAPPRPLLVVVDGLRDPGNLGTLIRAAHAAAAAGVFLLPGTVDLYHPRTVRATAGSLFHIPVASAGGDEVLALLRRRGVTIFAADVHGETSLYDCDLTGAAVLVLGSETAGARRALLDGADFRVRIPMPGGAESLNAAAAGAIFLFEGVRQRLKTSLCSG